MILMYHGVVDDHAVSARFRNGQAIRLSGLRQQFEWLRRRSEVVSLEEYLGGARNGSPRRRRIALTFDDGLAGTFRLLFPLLTELKLPATLFVTTAHLNGGPLLWFVYLNALCLESGYSEIAADGRRFALGSWEHRVRARAALEVLALRSGDPDGFVRQLERLLPIEASLAAEHEGMTDSDLAQAAGSPLLEIGAHSVSHPWLSLRPRPVQAAEILDSRVRLASLAGRPVRYFAYPGGDYNLETLEVVREAGFDAAVATIPKRLGSEPRYELGRVGVYSSSLGKLRLKVAGLATAARRLGIGVG